MEQRICEACGKDKKGYRGRICPSCYYKQQPRIPCAQCAKPTSRIATTASIRAGIENILCQLCRQPTRAEGRSDTCTEQGCTRATQSRNLCATHYTRWQRSQPGHTRTPRRRKEQGNCEYCAKPVIAYNKQRYCGLVCAARHKVSSSPEEYQTRHLAKRQVELYTGPTQRAPRPNKNPIKQSPRQFKSGQCKVCDSWFVTLYTDVTCSGQCQDAYAKLQRRIHKDRRRARKRKSYVADVSRKRVFMLDGYRCHLCNRKCNPTKTVPHPRAATIDHVIPLAAGGTHEPTNCRTACYQCNSSKSDGGGGEQFTLFG